MNNQWLGQQPDEVYLQVKRVHPDAITPKPPKYGDLGIDLFCCEHVTLEPGEQRAIRTGLAFKFPPQFGGIIRPRGRDKFLIGSGVIDAGYRGEILVRVFNTLSEPIEFHIGDSLGQLVLIPVWDVFIEEILDFEDTTERGESGGIWGTL